MMKICAIRSNSTRDLVLRRLTPPGLRGMVQGWFTGKLHALADVYVPYRLYKVTIADQRIRKTRYYAIDAATGGLDPYEFPAAAGPEALMEIETRNAHPVQVDEQQTNRVAIERVRRSLFSGGFFRLSNPVITANLVREDFYIPYWAAFCGDEQNLRVVVLNAVRQTREGNKVRQLIQNWLLERQGTAQSPQIYADANKS